MLIIILTKCLSIIRDDVHHIKSGEEDKKKIYRALCIIKGDVTEELMQKLTIEKEFVINQWTPLRVLHRRTLLNRPRSIFSVKPFAVKGKKISTSMTLVLIVPSTGKPNVVVLDIVTQAGTYVKELVHGELGRTEPSIASLIGMEIDIAALDVMNIELDFPKSLQR